MSKEMSLSLRVFLDVDRLNGHQPLHTDLWTELVPSPGLACGHHLAAVTCCQMLHIYIGTNTHSGWQPPSISLWICLRSGPRAPSSYAQVSMVLTSVPGKLKALTVDSAWRTTNQLNRTLYVSSPDTCIRSETYSVRSTWFQVILETTTEGSLSSLASAPP